MDGSKERGEPEAEREVEFCLSLRLPSPGLPVCNRPLLACFISILAGP